uniref:Uncharacterized protein n=1 Tax=Setaria viridis TaxID=4556 RepID=A0A4U6TKL7_SETVI|nr:hypothetical protein SEVIR_8G186101v2 [Setaria viridis]
MINLLCLTALLSILTKLFLAISALSNISTSLFFSVTTRNLLLAINSILLYATRHNSDLTFSYCSILPVELKTHTMLCYLYYKCFILVTDKNHMCVCILRAFLYNMGLACPCCKPKQD